MAFRKLGRRMKVLELTVPVIRRLHDKRQSFSRRFLSEYWMSHI